MDKYFVILDDKCKALKCESADKRCYQTKGGVKCIQTQGGW